MPLDARKRRIFPFAVTWPALHTLLTSMVLSDVQADWPLPYWPGVIVSHSIYALFEARRFQNFQKYKEVCLLPYVRSCTCSRRRCVLTLTLL